MKSRLVIYGNRDDEKDDIRKDSATEDMTATRFVISMAVTLGFLFAVADIKGAYMQSGPIERSIYLIPPKQLFRGRVILWDLQKRPYGIVEAGTQWLKVSDEWIQNRTKMESAPGLAQILTKRYTDGKVVLLVSNNVDDFLISGTRVELEDFFTALQYRFDVGKTEKGDTLTYNGCTIKASGGGSVTLDMVHHYERLAEVALN